MKSVKRQAPANILANHPSLEIEVEKSVELGIYGVEKEPWILKFDGLSTENSIGVGIEIISPGGVKTTLSFDDAFFQLELGWSVWGSLGWTKIAGGLN